MSNGIRHWLQAAARAYLLSSFLDEKVKEGVLSIKEAFGDLLDPRSRMPAYGFTEMLMVALCAILSGADSSVAIQLWGEGKLDWLRRHISLEHGIPSHDTFGPVFAALNPKQFESCFIRWTGQLCPALAGQVVTIDGKIVRGSHQHGERAIHLVSAYGATLGVVLGQMRTSEKSNKITAISELLDALMLKGAIVTIDAKGCQQNVARKIVDAGADYVLSAKENQPTLLANMRESLETIACEPQESGGSEYREVEKGHGRIETRRCIAIACPKPLGAPLRPHAQSIALVESTREIGDTVSFERRYYVSTLPTDAKHIAHAVRSHWAIENAMHWSLDVSLGKDQCRVRVNNAAQNFAILRRIVMLRQHKAAKGGLKIRRMLACASDRSSPNYLAAKHVSRFKHQLTFRPIAMTQKGHHHEEAGLTRTMPNPVTVNPGIEDCQKAGEPVVAPYHAHAERPSIERDFLIFAGLLTPPCKRYFCKKAGAAGRRFAVFQQLTSFKIVRVIAKAKRIGVSMRATWRTDPILVSLIVIAAMR